MLYGIVYEIQSLGETPGRADHDDVVLLHTPSDPPETFDGIAGTMTVGQKHADDDLSS